MLTVEQVMNVNEFHAGTCTITHGKRGSVRYGTLKLTRLGPSRKRFPTGYEIPVSYGSHIGRSGHSGQGLIAIADGEYRLDGEPVHVASDCQPKLNHTQDSGLGCRICHNNTQRQRNLESAELVEAYHGRTSDEEYVRQFVSDHALY